MLNIIDAIRAVVNFIGSLFSGIWWLITNLPQMQMLLYEVIAFCPPWLFVFLELSLLVTLLFAIFKLL